MLNRRSIYALNKKDTQAIVYTDADGKTIRLTCEDFASEEEFQAIKAWSDENYHRQEKEEHLFSNHTLPLVSAPEELLSCPSTEAIIEHIYSEQERNQYYTSLVSQIQGCLTETQFRRIWKFYVGGMTTREIAQAEGASHQGVSQSVIAARKKIIRLLKNTLPKGS